MGDKITYLHTRLELWVHLAITDLADTFTRMNYTTLLSELNS